MAKRIDPSESSESLTSRVLAVAGEGEHAAILMRLLEGEATTEQLRKLPSRNLHTNRYLRAELSQPTVSRYLTRLADVGLTGPGDTAKTYRLVHPQATRRFLSAANGLALSIGRARIKADEALRQGLGGAE